MGDAKYPPLPKVGPIGYASIVDVDTYAPWLKIGPHLPGVRDIALWTTDQMRAYVDADRAARAASKPRQARITKPGRGTLAAMRHPCPDCGAAQGARCATPSGAPREYVHSKRIDLARTKEPK